jgi:hypothetical protein
MRRLVRRVFDSLPLRRRFEVWEAADDLRPFFQVAGRLTRAEAIRIADRQARYWPLYPVLVLDPTGAPVYQAEQPAPAVGCSPLGARTPR